MDECENLENRAMKNYDAEQPAANRRLRSGARIGLWSALALLLVLAGANVLNLVPEAEHDGMVLASPPAAAVHTTSLRDGYFLSGQWRADVLTVAAAVRFLVES